MAGGTLRLSEVPVATLGAFVEACATYETSDLSELATLAGFSHSTARKAVPTLETLGVIQRTNGGPYSIAVEGVSRGMADTAVHQVIRRSVLGFRPFETLVEGLALGEAEDVAIRKTLMLLGLPNSEAPKLRTLLRWASDLGIVEFRDGKPRLIDELAVENVDELGALSGADVESEAKARLFNARRLGRDANNYLDEVDRGLLADALLKYESDARRSIEAAGQALEDFLRHVSTDRGLDSEAKKASGAGQLSNLLYTRGVIHSHQQKMVDAIATVRNATAHRKDKKTLTPWELTSFGAFSAISMTLTTIRSIHHYVQKGRQTI
jgi:hypothetical protein